jgi:hypothetical protein
MCSNLIVKKIYYFFVFDQKDFGCHPMRHLMAKLNNSINAFTNIILNKQRILNINCRVDGRLRIAFDSLGLRVQTMANVNVKKVVLKPNDQSIKNEIKLEIYNF